MNCLRYWARYVRKGEVKGEGIKNGNESASWNIFVPTIHIYIYIYIYLFKCYRITQKTLSLKVDSYH